CCYTCFHRTQQEALAKEKELKEKQLQKAFHHAETLRQQMKELELSALAKRREKFKEADRLIEEERQRRMRLSLTCMGSGGSVPLLPSMRLGLLLLRCPADLPPSWANGCSVCLGLPAPCSWVLRGSYCSYH
ncbi:hypothetical protein GOODEAATRI_009832, partial [Goodea atripinnis]